MRELILFILLLWSFLTIGLIIATFIFDLSKRKIHKRISSVCFIFSNFSCIFLLFTVAALKLAGII